MIEHKSKANNWDKILKKGWRRIITIAVFSFFHIRTLFEFCVIGRRTFRWWNIWRHF